jgi:F-type H+-transporting ATPase subunit b
LKRFLAVVSFTVLAAAAPALAAQPSHAGAAGAEAAHHSEGGDPDLPWKIANFAVLVGGLGYLIYKKAGGFFVSRTAHIRQGLEESARLKAEAETRYAAMEQRLAQLGAQIETLRAQAGQESRAEAERVRTETEREIAKVQAQSTQDIESAAKTARHELRSYAAGLAVSLAERKIREQLTPDSEKTLLHAMLNDFKGREGAASPRVS